MTRCTWCGAEGTTWRDVRRIAVLVAGTPVIVGVDRQRLCTVTTRDGRVNRGRGCLGLYRTERAIARGDRR